MNFFFLFIFSNFLPQFFWKTSFYKKKTCLWKNYRLNSTDDFLKSKHDDRCTFNIHHRSVQLENQLKPSNLFLSNHSCLPVNYYKRNDLQNTCTNNNNNRKLNNDCLLTHAYNIIYRIIQNSVQWWFHDSQ